MLCLSYPAKLSCFAFVGLYCAWFGLFDLILCPTACSYVNSALNNTPSHAVKTHRAIDIINLCRKEMKFYLNKCYLIVFWNQMTRWWHFMRMKQIDVQSVAIFVCLLKFLIMLTNVLHYMHMQSDCLRLCFRRHWKIPLNHIAGTSQTRWRNSLTLWLPLIKLV